MSSWCPDARGARLPCRRAMVLVAAGALASTAHAADWTVFPLAEVSAETNTNRDLTVVPADEIDASALVVEAGMLVRAISPRSNTLLRPLVRWNEFSETSTREGLEGLLLLRNDFRTQRSTFSVVGRASHLDFFNSELPDAEFDDEDPDDPTVPDSGQSRDGDTRDRASVGPRIEYSISQLWGVGGSAYYEVARYEAEDGSSGGADYDYGRIDAFLTYRISERTRAEFGPYATRYEASDDSLQVDGHGATVNFIYDWSEQFRGALSLGYEGQDTDHLDPTIPDESTSGWHARVQLDRTGEINRLRVTAGRSYSPSGRGVVTTVDEARVQFDRDLSQRAMINAAVRYVQSSAIGDLDDSGDYDYFRGELQMKYRFTPAWFVSGGVQYSWRERESDVDDADNESVFVRVGYDPQTPTHKLPGQSTTDRP